MIQGAALRDAFISAANHLTNHRQQIDALNVFPVPDGDTGTNMSMTMNAARRELERLENVSSSEVAKAAASALLRGARGNSGVITSLLFRGFSKSAAGKTELGGSDLADALTAGVEAAYKAVMKPTEGTILTVARLAAATAKEAADSGADEVLVLEQALEEAKRALLTTPELLPVLKKAGVVDAGGKGYVYILEGMVSVLRDGVIIGSDTEKADPEIRVQSAARDSDIEITFLYCTEFLINKRENTGDALQFRAFIESIGDSAVIVDDDEIIKCHVHTDNPGDALQEALKYGMLSSIKIENMYEQHEELQHNAPKQEIAPKQESGYVPVDPQVPYGFVAVAAGDGMHALFADLGVSSMVNGGQTMNPSTDDILRAIHATPAQTVFVFPNNKNIIMAAEQAVHLADRKVCVMPTRTIPQGISAMLAFDPDADLESNRIAMMRAIDQVQTGNITFAARDADIDGFKIREGELMALENGRLVFTGRDLERACVKLIRQMLKKNSSFVTMYYGSDVSAEQAEAIEKAVRERIPADLELMTVSGGQPVYYFIIAVE